MNVIPLPQNNVVIHKTPHPALQPFISHYVYRHIILPTGYDMEKAMPIRTVSSVDFFIGDRFETFDDATGISLPFERCTIRGPRTCKKYSILISSLFISFTIKFRPAGLYRLLGMPVSRFVNEAVPAGDIQPVFNEITRQLLYADNITKCISIAEPFLIMLAQKNINTCSSISEAARYLVQQKGNVSVMKLANESNLSLRQFERNFTKEIGVSPKVYARMLRFYNMLQIKMRTPDAKWTSVAYDAGYFDQMHLVREFRQFLGINPSAFVRADFAF